MISMKSQRFGAYAFPSGLGPNDLRDHLAKGRVSYGFYKDQYDMCVLIYKMYCVYIYIHIYCIVCVYI